LFWCPLKFAHVCLRVLVRMRKDTLSFGAFAAED
jgi:hypothetical protein